MIVPSIDIMDGRAVQLVGGKEKVLGEVCLAFTAYNLKRALSVLGFEALMGRMQACRLSFKRYIQRILSAIEVKISFSERSFANYEFLLLKI